MMFMISQGERVVVVGPPEREHCPHCGEERDFIPQLKYSFGAFDLLFGFTYNRKYQLACTVCNHGWRLDRTAAHAAYGKPPIPFMLQYGLAVLCVLLAGLGAAAYAYRMAG